MFHLKMKRKYILNENIYISLKMRCVIYIYIYILLPESCDEPLGVHCRSSSQTWAAGPGPISSSSADLLDSQTFWVVVGQLDWIQSAACKRLMSLL